MTVADSLRLVIAHKDSLIEAAATRTVHVTVPPQPLEPFWASPLFQTLLGGALALAGGILADWLSHRRENKEKAELMMAVVRDEMSAIATLMPPLVPFVSSGQVVTSVVLTTIDECRGRFRETLANIVYLRPRSVRPRVTGWFREVSVVRALLEDFLPNSNPNSARARQMLGPDLTSQINTLVTNAGDILLSLGLILSTTPGQPHRAVPRPRSRWRRLFFRR